MSICFHESKTEDCQGLKRKKILKAEVHCGFIHAKELAGEPPDWSGLPFYFIIVIKKQRQSLSVHTDLQPTNAVIEYRVEICSRKAQK